MWYTVFSIIANLLTIGVFIVYVYRPGKWVHFNSITMKVKERKVHTPCGAEYEYEILEGHFLTDHELEEV